MRRLLDIVIVVEIVIIAAIVWDRSYRSYGTVERDTVRVTVWDTMRVRVPDVASTAPIGLRSYRVKLLGRIARDTGYRSTGADEPDKANKAAGADSVEVELPITQTVYEDSTYRAWVSGFDARLDSIEVYRPIRYVTMTVKEPQSRWSWGLQMGMGMTPKGLQPYLGIGGEFRF